MRFLQLTKWGLTNNPKKHFDFVRSPQGKLHVNLQVPKQPALIAEPPSPLSGTIHLPLPALLSSQQIALIVKRIRLSFFVAASALFACVTFDLTAGAQQKEEPAYRSLFNGKDLTGWVPKIRGEKLGENYGNTFRVEDGVLKVAYDREKYPEFGEKFGHLFFVEKFSHYRIRLEYRFTGDQCKGGPGWAFRNSGIMVHGEDPEGMTIDQDFPASIEVQLLGGPGQGDRPTANLCTPGTNVVMNKELVTRHCTNSRSKTFHGDQWVKVEVEVRGSEVIRHFVNGELVLEYQQPQLDDRDGHAKELATKNKGQLLIEKGTISLQSESHPVEFRKIEILDLSQEPKGK